MDHTTAELGSVVHIMDSEGDRSMLLVAPEEVDPFTNRISVESPLGKALLHKHKDDLVQVKGSHSRSSYIISDIHTPKRWDTYIW